MQEVQGYPNYLIGSDGTVIGARNKKLCVDLNRVGYERVSLCKGGKVKRVFVHKLVAEHYVPNPEGFSIVNHKDGNKRNNNADNLEWTTHQKNLKHAIDSGLRDMKGRKMMSRETKQSCIDLLLDGRYTYQQIADMLDVSYNSVALTNRRLKERATTIPNGSTSQANGDGSAQPS